jgi:hypothetical protein
MKPLPQRLAPIARFISAAAPTMRMGGVIELALMLVGMPEGLYYAIRFGLTMIWFRAVQIFHGAMHENMVPAGTRKRI